MGRSILVVALAAGAGLLGFQAGASAQTGPQPYLAAVPGVEPQPRAASPGGAVYIPGVGFRYLAAGGPRVYGWTSNYRSRVYGYRSRAGRRACRDHDWWLFDRCERRWR